MTQIESARKCYRVMLNASGMTPDDFKAACEQHPAFNSAPGWPLFLRYASAAGAVIQDIRADKRAKRSATIQARAKVTTAKCERCGGAGRISAFKHVNAGICFDCEGTGKDWRSPLS